MVTYVLEIKRVAMTKNLLMKTLYATYNYNNKNTNNNLPNISLHFQPLCVCIVHEMVKNIPVFVMAILNFPPHIPEFISSCIQKTHIVYCSYPAFPGISNPSMAVLSLKYKEISISRLYDFKSILLFLFSPS